jgi:RNA polymerase sigma-70 factor (ECF subfamily)
MQQLSNETKEIVQVTESDEMLIENIKNGSIENYDTLMHRYQDDIYYIAFQYTRVKEQALDVSQNIFFKAYESLPRFESRSSFKTWLFRIAYNECQNWVKKNRRFQHEEFDMHVDSAPNQEEQLLSKEQRLLILKSLYQLNTRYRLAVVLRYFRNNSIKEISDIIGCSEGVVKNMLFRSLQKLKTILQKDVV